MARIGLWFRTRRVISPRLGNTPVTIIRLLARVRFGKADGSVTEPWEAIIDTGAPLGVIPRRVWQDLDYDLHIADTSFGGLSPRKVCEVRASFATVRGQLEDKSGAPSRWYDFPAFLAHTDRVPLIIGFAGLLERFKTCFDHAADEAWVEEH